MDPEGLEAVFLANREKLLSFIVAHGGGESAEDVLRDVWFAITATSTSPIAAPLSYLYRALNTAMIDRFRASRQAAVRNRAGSEVVIAAVSEASGEQNSNRGLVAREQATLANAALEAAGARAAAVFRRHRIEGMPQTQVAREFGITRSTVESDLRKAYRAMIEQRRRIDEE